MNTRSRTPVAALMVVGSCVSLQFGAGIATPLFAILGPAFTTTARLLIAGIVLAVVFRPRFWSWTRRQWRAVLLFGVAMAGMNGCFYAAIDRIPLGIVLRPHREVPEAAQRVTEEAGTVDDQHALG